MSWKKSIKKNASPDKAGEYEVLEKNEDISKLTADKKRIIEIYLKYNRKNQHKMKPIPICKIPKKCFTKN